MADDHLIRAARNGQREIAHELLQLPGIDANAADTEGTTALYWAARNGQREIVHELLQLPGIDANAADTEGMAMARPLPFHVEGLGYINQNYWKNMVTGDLELRKPGRGKCSRFERR